MFAPELKAHHLSIIGQVGGVAVSAAIFQSILNTELHKRVHGDDAEDVSGIVEYCASVSNC